MNCQARIGSPVQVDHRSRDEVDNEADFNGAIKDHRKTSLEREQVEARIERHDFQGTDGARDGGRLDGASPIRLRVERPAKLREAVRRQLVLSPLRPAGGRFAELHLPGHCGTDWRLALERGSAVARGSAVPAGDGGRLLDQCAFRESVVRRNRPASAGGVR